MTRQQCLIRWISVLAIVLLGSFFTLGLSMKDNSLDLLPDGVVREDLQLLQQIGLVDRIIITLRADKTIYPSRVMAQTTLERSGIELEKLLGSNDNFSHVFARFNSDKNSQSLQAFTTILPALTRPTDLEKLKKRLNKTTISSQMEKNFILLNSLAGIPLKQQLQKDPLDFSSILVEKLGFLRNDFNINLQNGFLTSADGRNILIFAESNLSLTDSNNARKIQNNLEQIYKQVLPTGITPHVIGTLPHTLANSQTIKGNLHILLPIASILLFLLLAATLKSIRAIVVFAVPLLASLPAIAITAYFFNGISGLALGFGIVLLGIAVDFSVHLFVALTSNHGEPREIIKQMRRPILFATATTASVFLVLFFSDVPAHRQMACLALSGILLGVSFAWLLIPTVSTVSKSKTHCSISHSLP